MRDIPFGKPIITDDERNAVLKVLEGTTLTHGPLVREFEAAFARFTGARQAVALSSCTAALHLAYFYLGIGSGDEVIVPAQTHVATAHAVELVGAKPVFIDSESQTGNMDIGLLEGLITTNTKAISVVHYLGMPVDMHRVMQIARQHGLFVVEDCALAIGTYLGGTHAGLFGDVGCFSFYPVKHITTAEGGMLITNNDDIAAGISRQRAFGIDRNIVSERPMPGVYDVVELGLNYRLNEIGAAMGIEQMKKLAGFLARRQENYQALAAGLGQTKGIRLFQSTHGEFQSSHYCQVILLDEQLSPRRFEIVKFLKEMGIGTSIYYPKALPQMTYYRRKYGYDEQTCPVASGISNSSIALPVGFHVTGDDIEYIIAGIQKAITEVGIA